MGHLFLTMLAVTAAFLRRSSMQRQRFPLERTAHRISLYWYKLVDKQLSATVHCVDGKIIRRSEQS
jgi:hypothetical protein